MRRIRVRTLVNAIRKNGYPKIKGHYQGTFSIYDSKLDKMIVEKRYCAFGQAAKNLRVNPSTLHTSTSRLNGALANRIIRLNDTEDKPIPEIADIIEQEFPNLLDQYIIYEY